MTDADDRHNQILALTTRATATRTARALHVAGEWPEHVHDSLPALGATVPPRAPATALQVHQYDAVLQAIDREIAAILALKQRPNHRRRTTNGT